MKIVVDANILFSFFNSKSVVRDLVIDPEFKYNLELVSPELLLSELDKRKSDICKKAGISEEEYEFPRNTLEVFVKIIPNEFWQESKEEAFKLIPRHTKDVPYLALALSLNCAVWSNEVRLKKQGKVKVFSTEDLLKKFGLI